MSHPPGTTRKGVDTDDGGTRPDSFVTPLSDGQWAYLQRRYELTTRERQVAELVCRGLRNDRIAAHLRVRPETVKTHVRNIYRKTGVRSKMLLLLRFIAEAEHGRVLE